MEAKFQQQLGKLSQKPTGYTLNSIFGTSSNQEEEQQESTTSLLGNLRERGNGLLSSVGIGGPSSEELDCLGLSRFQRYAAFLLLLALSLVCFSIAFFSLFTLVISPSKFAVSYTFGSLLCMLAFAVLKGLNAFFKHVISRDRILFTLLYFGSMGLTLYFAVGSHSYLGTLASSMVQFVALFWYFGSYLPGGTSGLGFMSKWFARRTVGLPV